MELNRRKFLTTSLVYAAILAMSETAEANAGQKGF